MMNNLGKLQTQIAQNLLKQIEVEKEISRRLAKDSLYHYVKYMWKVIEPETPFVDGWHIHALCAHAEAVTEFLIKELNVNMPPRHMKSIIWCVMWPSWVWGKYPERSFIFGSHSLALATRDSIKTRQLINSEEYKEVFDQQWTLADDQDQKTIFKNSRGGIRKAVGVGSAVTGEGADYLVTDDPINALEAHSEVTRLECIRWNDTVLSTRINNPRRYAKINIMQRLHDQDLSGHIIKTQKSFEHLILSARYNPDAELKSKTSLNFKDPRTKKGELLWSNQWDKEAIDKLEKQLGDDASAQLDQEPRSAGGGFIPKEYWNYYDTPPSTILEVIMFIDAAQKPGVSNDFSVYATWARTPNAYYLLDLSREKTDGPLLEELTIVIYNKWHHNDVVIEDKSAGSSLIQYLLNSTALPVTPFNPGRFSKEVRAAAAKPTIKAGKCFLPLKPIWGEEDGEKVNLVEVFVKEHEKFLKASNDDTVDTTSMMVKYFSTSEIIQPGIRSL